jgi:hypothetical protein
MSSRLYDSTGWGGVRVLGGGGGLHRRKTLGKTIFKMGCDQCGQEPIARRGGGCWRPFAYRPQGVAGGQVRAVGRGLGLPT